MSNSGESERWPSSDLPDLKLSAKHRLLGSERYLRDSKDWKRLAGV